MRLYNIFESDRKLYHHKYPRGYHSGFGPERHITYEHSPMSKGHYGLYLIKKIWSNRKLRLLLFLLTIILLMIMILVIIFGLKLLGSLAGFIRTEGLEGIIGTIKGFIDKLLTGTG
jgi:hypothetical protein